MYLATGSQDTYIRVYKFEKRNEIKNSIANDPESCMKMLELEAKFIKVGSTFNEHYFAVILETILAGHESWVYGVSWSPENYSNLSQEISRNERAEITGKVNL